MNERPHRECHGEETRSPHLPDPLTPDTPDPASGARGARFVVFCIA